MTLIKQCTKKASGRRFSDEEKLISMAIMKQSPKCYRFLHKIFILPSKYTLNKMIAELNIEAGINAQIFEAISQFILPILLILQMASQNWQQPLAFYFCKGATSGVELKILIEKIITAVANTGLKPVAVVCDQGTAFQAALKGLQEETRRNQIIAGIEIGI
ncbi:uncharacterized protein LOC126964709 [Leptidea sinapis]|uniref:uncharacterized protein LOC126964709 n=1 Tax=Leptidea sinapis TaxID=189913 RepID=UPI0021C3E196|nr:uncharacterized protein LOC126964709 [Leptidea sinapis]